MFFNLQALGHFIVNHFVLYTPAQPVLVAASVNSSIAEDSVNEGFKKKFFPLNSDAMNMFHAAMSFLASLVKRRKWKGFGFFKLQRILYSRRMNALPGTTTIQAKFKCPRSDWKFRTVIFEHCVALFNPLSPSVSLRRRKNVTWFPSVSLRSQNNQLWVPRIHYRSHCFSTAQPRVSPSVDAKCLLTVSTNDVIIHSV